MNNPKTIFCDLDGTLVKHPGSEGVLQNSTDPNHELELLPGTHEFLKWVDLNRHYLVITTGRKESCREATIKQLQRANIWYDQLIMGFGSGDRILINDKKTDGRETASAINLERNGGIKDVQI